MRELIYSRNAVYETLSANKYSCQNHLCDSKDAIACEIKAT